jgi:hypothetical protein
MAPFQIKDIQMADAVVIGRAIDYEMKEGFAAFTIDVERTLNGKEYATDRLLTYGDTVEVSWQNSTFQLPDRLLDARHIFALRRTGESSLPLRAPTGVLFGDPEGYEYTLLQAPCSRPFNLPYSVLSERDIQHILDGGEPLLDFDYGDPDQGAVYRVLELELLLKFAGGTILALMIGLAFAIRRIRKLK